MKKIFISIFTIFISTMLFSQNGFNYQAVIRDANNNILNNSNVSLKISILDNINGNVLYSELFDLTTNNYGLINTVIGSGNPLVGDFSQINWNKKYFVKIELDANNSGNFELMGINRLQSVPYAFFSTNANHSVYADTALFVKQQIENKKINLSFGPTNSISVNKSTGYTVSDLSKCILNFDIANYTDKFNTITLYAIAKSNNSANNFIVDLIDLNTNQVIGSISGNNTNYQLVHSSNLISNLPANVTNLGVRISSNDGQNYVSLQKVYLLIENKKLVSNISN